jgi:menaquinol-cytochrome c reductase iron-sulfur subunit
MEPDVSQTQAQGLIDAKSRAQGESQPSANGDAPMADPGRRAFLHKTLAILVGGFIMIVPAAAGVLTFLTPIRRRKEAGGADAGKPFIKVTSLSAVPPDGKAHRFPIIADRADAWTIERNVPIGSVYLKREGERLIAWNTRCPHLGCAVDTRGDGSFACPCHNSSFRPDGSVVSGSVSARGLDELEIDRKALAQGDVRVRYVEFETGRADKIVKA